MLRDLVDELNFLLVKVHVLHVIELGFELMQVAVELLSFVGDAGASAGTTGCLWRQGTGLRSLRRFTVFVISVEFINFIMNRIQSVIHLRKLVSWIPGADYFFTIIKLGLQTQISLKLLKSELTLELLRFVGYLSHLHLEFNTIAHLGAFDKL